MFTRDFVIILDQLSVLCLASYHIRPIKAMNMTWTIKYDQINVHHNVACVRVCECMYRLAYIQYDSLYSIFLIRYILSKFFCKLLQGLPSDRILTNCGLVLPTFSYGAYLNYKKVEKWAPRGLSAGSRIQMCYPYWFSEDFDQSPHFLKRFPNVCTETGLTLHLLFF